MPWILYLLFYFWFSIYILASFYRSYRRRLSESYSGFGPKSSKISVQYSRPRIMAGGPDLYVGIDLSTQSCKVHVVDANLKLVGAARVQFDADLGAKYGVKDGVVRDDGGRVRSPTLMWAEALELAMKRLQQSVGSDVLSRVKCISGSGQQHGSVYWSKDGPGILSSLDASSGKPIEEQLADAFVVESGDKAAMSPIWMDTSGTAECRNMEETVGGADKLSLKTGSRAYERFTAHLISQFLKKGFGTECSRISLVSSLGTSLLCGAVKSIDHSDAAGMNLMNLDSSDWDPQILQYLQQIDAKVDVRSLLGTPADAKSMAGSVSQYYIQKFGFSPSCQVNHWTGDNPSSVVGLGMLLPGDIAISLGTSDTLLAVVDRAPESSRKPLPFGHLFPHPCLQDKLFLMLCYTNGDVTRRAVRDSHADGSWDKFTEILQSTQPGNGNHFATSDGKTFHKVGTFSDEQNVRGVVESRALAMYSHMNSLGFYTPEGRLLMTGGGSANPAIRQVFADVFARQVYTLDSADSAATGAAVRAMDACGDLDIATLKGMGDAKEGPVSSAAYETVRGPFQMLEDSEMQLNARL